MQEFQKMLYHIVFMYRLYDIIIICYTDHMTSCGTIYCTGHMTLSHHGSTIQWEFIKAF